MGAQGGEGIGGGVFSGESGRTGGPPERSALGGVKRGRPGSVAVHCGILGGWKGRTRLRGRSPESFGGLSDPVERGTVTDAHGRQRAG